MLTGLSRSTVCDMYWAKIKTENANRMSTIYYNRPILPFFTNGAAFLDDLQRKINPIKFPP